MQDPHGSGIGVCCNLRLRAERPVLRMLHLDFSCQASKPGRNLETLSLTDMTVDKSHSTFRELAGQVNECNLDLSPTVGPP
jgi:hypothetical protein